MNGRMNEPVNKWRNKWEMTEGKQMEEDGEKGGRGTETERKKEMGGRKHTFLEHKHS